MTTWTLFENFEGFSQILQEQSDKKRYLGVFTHQIAKIEKFENCCILRKFDYADTRFSNFAIEYLCNIFAKTKKFAKLFQLFHMGPRLNILSLPKNGQKSRDTVPLRRRYGNMFVDLSSLVLIYDTNFMKQIKFSEQKLKTENSSLTECTNFHVYKITPLSTQRKGQSTQ